MSTALQPVRTAVPGPWQAEARQAFRQDGLLQASGLPALSAIDRHVHALDLAAPRPGQPGDLVEATLTQLMPTGRRRDHRFRLHGEGELACRAVRHEVGVFRRFFAGLEWLVADL